MCTPPPRLPSLSRVGDPVGRALATPASSSNRANHRAAAERIIGGVTLESRYRTIPGEHTKNAEPHRVPLSAEAVAIMRAHSPKDGDDRPEHVFTGLGGDTIMHRAKKAPSAIARVLKVDFRGHDLRRTAATYMAAAGIPREHIGHVLNHVEGGARATRVYDRYAYDREKWT